MIHPSLDTIEPVDGPAAANCRLTNSAPPNVSTWTTESCAARDAFSNAACSSSSSGGAPKTERQNAYKHETTESWILKRIGGIIS